jgi:tRNA A-37 threonylcarbamoyl transferase component Bud32
MVIVSLHEQGILHGDLTAANVMLHGGWSCSCYMLYVTSYMPSLDITIVTVSLHKQDFLHGGATR